MAYYSDKSLSLSRLIFYHKSKTRPKEIIGFIFSKKERSLLVKEVPRVKAKKSINHLWDFYFWYLQSLLYVPSLINSEFLIEL